MVCRRDGRQEEGVGEAQSSEMQIWATTMWLCGESTRVYVVGFVRRVCPAPTPGSHIVRDSSRIICYYFINGAVFKTHFVFPCPQWIQRNLFFLRIVF